MEVTAADFEKMKWDIYKIPLDKRIIIEIPELFTTFQDFANVDFKLAKVTHDQLFRYIIYTYHKLSPLIKKEDDVNVRKKYALHLAGIKDFTTKDVLTIVDHQNEEIAACILQFLKFERDMKWAAFIMQVDAYYAWNKALLNPTANNPIDRLKDLEKSMEDLAEQILRGDTKLINFIAANEIIQNRPKITPEQRSRK